MLRRLMCLAMLGGLVTAFGVFAGAGASSASTPSGQVMYGNTTFVPSPTPPLPPGHFAGGGGTIEPAYDSANGTLIFLQTPNNAHVNPNDHNVAPLYLPVYPVGSDVTESSLNCTHLGGDNCPDHGPAVAAAAMFSTNPQVASVYSKGVLGHDHLAGIASSGGDFNVIWEPELVLFTNAQAANQHITTLAQVMAVLAPGGGAILVKLPQLDFHCSVVSAAAYARGIPAPIVFGP
jgi:hypothetical protein